MVFATITPETKEISSLVTTTKIMLVVEYNGTRYHGFQLQAGLPTIQEEIENALWKLAGERIRVVAAGRTDAGVHARGQVISFRTRSSLPPPTFINGLNYYLPRDIAVKAAHRVDDSFSARRNALSREYTYRILNSSLRSPLCDGFAYLVAGRLDIEAMNQACQALIGKHDFASFASCIEVGIKTVRNVHKAEVREEEEMVIFNMVANSFLPHQVRSTVGSLIRIGLGKMTLNEFHAIIKARRLGLAGPTAPACGLFLMRVNYPNPSERFTS